MSIELLFDLLLAGTLIWLAWRIVTLDNLFKEVILFIIFGLIMALTWVRLDAADIALAEAAIGTGLTGALLLDAARQMTRDRRTSPDGAAGRERKVPRKVSDDGCDRPPGQ